ncbi:MAG TPA: glycosyltransferase family 4 protein [Anaerolineales bacterium]|nr:glycosyltransferase family 4 protein [Anaerolineales bacterium]
MRVLILHMRYWPEATGTGPLVTELAEDLAAAGEDVVVVTSVPHYGLPEIPAEFRGGLIHRALKSGVTVYRTLAPVAHVGSALGRGLDYAAYTVLASLAAISLGPVDIILCVAPPVTVGFSGWVVGFLRKCPTVFNAQDIWPDGLISMGRIHNQVLIAVLRRLEQLVYRTSNRITVVSEGMRKNVLSKGVAAGRVQVIPNWVDTERIHPVEGPNPFRNELALGESFVVLFAGNVGYAAGLESVLAAAGLLRGEPRICFLIVGEGSAKADLLRAAEREGLTNVRFLPTQPSGILSNVLGAGDVGLVPLREGMGAVSVPSKAYAIMAGGRPVLAAVPTDSEIRHLVAEAKCGVCVPAEEPQALAEAVLRLAGEPDRLKEYGRNARSYVVERYSRAIMTSRYRKLLGEVIEAGKRTSKP